MSTVSSCTEESNPQVFINFRGEEMRLHFIGHLVKELKRRGINVFIDNHETMGEDLTIFYERIEKSKIAVAVISSKYTQSLWCLNELVRITECADAGKLKVFPVFYKVSVDAVRDLTGPFGDSFRVTKKKDPESSKKWKEALRFVTKKKGHKVKDDSDGSSTVDKIADELKKMLDLISKDETENPKPKTPELVINPSKSSPTSSTTLSGIKTRLEELEQKLILKSSNKKIDDVTRIIGLIGMPGIGKTKLAKSLIEKWQHKFVHKMYLDDIRQKSDSLIPERLEDELLSGLWNSKYSERSQYETHQLPTAYLKSRLRVKKVFIVLDDVTKKSQIEGILGDREWIKQGSKVVIISSNISAIQGIEIDDTYLVPLLNHEDALQHFTNYAGEIKDGFKKLASEFVDYSKGHPLALKVLGTELSKKDEKYWESKLETLTKSPSNTIQDVLRIPNDELNEKQKDVLLDIACFFRYEDEYNVRSLLENASEIRDLADKFLINICGGRIEINDMLYTFAMGLDSQASSENARNKRRLFNHLEIITLLNKTSEPTTVRGIFLDMAEVTRKMSFDSDTFEKMDNLRYLKFFNSRCPIECEDDYKLCFPGGSHECKSECKLNFPEKLKFKLTEIRYFNWLKFPLKKFPRDFDPKNLIDLKLPYSQIKKVWKGEKDTSKLKWLDLNHSVRLRTLSGLSQARNLLTMNLEGCIKLKIISHENVQNMENLVFLNLRGCTRLESFSEMNLISLKTLILSGCSKLEKFDLIAGNLEELHLDGTAITELPLSIRGLKKLILLNLKDCIELLSLPDCLEDLKALQELILSGCLKLASFPVVKQNLRVLKTLLLDGTAITEVPNLLLRQTSSSSRCDLCEWPRGDYSVSSVVQRLCLSRNGITSLPSSISNLYHLKWFDLKYCKNLKSLPLLPPNLQWFDAHGCESLEKIDKMFAILSPNPNHLHSKFIFTNCSKLDQDSKNSIISYARRKIQLISDGLTRYDEAFVLDILIGICFPGGYVPVWFNHRSVGSSLNSELPKHWSENVITGVAICAVVSFKNYQGKITRLLVRCSGEFTEEDGSCIPFSCILGGWTEPGSCKPLEINSDHIFIGYTSWLRVKKRDRDVLDRQNSCVVTQAFLEFEVTDGTKVVTDCEVIKCGFTLIYQPSEADHTLFRKMLSSSETPDSFECFHGEVSSSELEQVDERKLEIEVVRSNINSSIRELKETCVGDFVLNSDEREVKKCVQPLKSVKENDQDLLSPLKKLISSSVTIQKKNKVDVVVIGTHPILIPRENF